MLDSERNLRIGQRSGAAASPGVQIHDALSMPPDGYRGQMIWRVDTQVAMVFDGTSWMDIVGGVAGIHTFVVESTPVADNVGDLWLQPSTAVLKIWDGQAWTQVIDPAAQDALTQAAQALDLANANSDDLAILSAEVDGKTVTFYQAQAPTAADGVSINDLWYDTVNHLLYRYNGSLLVDPWDLIRDGQLTQATAQIGDLGAKVDQKVETYFNTWATRPTGLDSTHIGDLMYASDQGNKCYVYSSVAGGLDWVPLLVGNGALDTGAVGSGNLTADAINGKTITGATVQTSTIANQGIKLDATANTLTAYAPDGTPAFAVDGGTGTTSMIGKLATGMKAPYTTIDDWTQYGSGIAKIAFVMQDTATVTDDGRNGFIECVNSGTSGQQLVLSSGNPTAGTGAQLELASSSSGTTIQLSADTSYVGGSLSVNGAAGFASTATFSSAVTFSSTATFSSTVALSGSGFYRFLNTSGPGLRRIDYIRTTLNLDVGGIAVVNHKLGVTPSVVLTQVHNTGDGTPVVIVTAKDASTFTVRYQNNGALVTSTTRTIEWIALA